jgi:peptidoglycan/xylan/chitin deacetylase (PgdA/CDA1 family)
MRLRTEIKKKLKTCAFSLFGNSLRINWRIRKINEKNLLTIINLHKVSIYDDSSYKALNPEILRNLIIFLKKNFEITSFYEINKMNELNSLKSSKPKVIISFDDGYKNFITEAHPVLAEFEIRANQNIIPKCVDTNKPPLNIALQDFVGKNNRNIFQDIVIPGYEWNKNLNKIQEGNLLSQYIKKQTYKKQQELEKNIIDQIGQDLYKFSTPMMDIFDIKKIFSFYDWGAHSYSHSNMNEENNSFFKKDLKLCDEWFLKNLGIKPIIYAFPNGSYNQKNLMLAKKAGYKFILLVDNKFSNTNSSIHPRFNFYAETNSEMRFKTLGSFASLA